MNTNIGKLISSRRKELNMTQEQLAEKLFVSRKVISRWELNERVPNTLIIKDLCEVLQISIEEFYNGINYNLIDLDKNYILKVLKKIISYGIIGSIILSLFAFLFINFKDLMNWDEVYIETVWINIFFIIGLNFYVMLSCFNGCLIFYINHQNNMKKQKINFINLFIIILSIIIEFILLTIYIIICFNSYNNKNCLLWLLYYLFTCVVPTISIIIIINLLKIKLKNKYKNK